MKHRVFITGIGCVTPAGIGRAEFWQGLHSPISSVRKISRFDPEPFHSGVAGEVHHFAPENWIPAKALKRMDRFSRFSVAAARMAVEDAELNLEELNVDRIGCFLGSSLGGVSFGEIQYKPYFDAGLRAVDPSLALTVFAGAGSCNIAMHLGICGPTSANSDACASGTVAIGRALRSIQEGEADVMLAGASEAPLTQLSLGAYDLLKLVSTKHNDAPERASRPFDVDSDGFVLSEGSALLVMESEEHAARRGAKKLAEVVGAASTHDAYSMTEPRPDAVEAARCMSGALQDAGVSAQQLSLVIPHGVGIPAHDRLEARAIQTVLGDEAARVPVLPTKSRTGHPLGASGAIDAALLALCLHQQYVPEVVNLEHPDPQCPLHFGNGTVGCLETGLASAFSFGGINASLVLRRVS